MSEKKKKTTKVANPHAGHRQRFRTRYIKGGGLDAFADHEVVEFLLYYGIPQKNTNQIAHKILKEFGKLHNLFEASPKQIMARTGLTENTATLLSMVSQLAKRYQYDKWEKRIVFEDSKQIGEYMKIAFIDQSLECFYMMCLDNGMALRGLELLEKGTLDSVELHPHKIVDFALMNKASYVVLAHNHPSGDERISEADLNATVDIVQQLRPFNVYVLDHFIMVGEKYISLAENGFMRMKGFGTKE